MDVIQKISPRSSFSKRGITPPFGKGGVGRISRPESRISAENWDSVFEKIHDFCRNAVLTPVSTGVMTLYDNNKKMEEGEENVS
jgi:hypothetical protein